MILPRKPVRGEPVTAQLVGRMIDYMRRITPLRGPGVLTQATPGGTIISAAASGAAAANEGPFPYEVRVVSKRPTASGGEAQTVLAIYTPEGVLCVDGDVVASIDTAAAVQGMGDGWYSYAGVEVPSAGMTTSVWLRVTWPDPSSTAPEGGEAPAAEIYDGDDENGGTGSGAGTVHRILLATVSRSSGGSITVSQFVFSALAFFAPVTSGGDAGAAIPGPFEPVHDATTGLLTGFTHCIYCAERQFVECGTAGGMAISGVTASTSGYVVLTLRHDAYASASANVIDNDNVSVAIENALPMNDSDAVTKIPLFHITNGVVDVDLRAVPTGVLAR